LAHNFRLLACPPLTDLIFTFNLENSVPQKFIAELFAEIATAGMFLTPACLSRALHSSPGASRPTPRRVKNVAVLPRG
jgi:hypothetical protein